MPVFGISDNEIEDVFVVRQNDDGGMPHLGLNVHELIDTGDRLDAQHGAAILGGTGRRLSKPQKRGSDDGRKCRSAPPRERLCESSMSHSV